MAQAAKQTSRRRTYDELVAECRGRWPEIISALVPQLRDVINSSKEKFDCPVHSGKNDGYLFKDFAETGGTGCWGACGAHPNGFGTIAWVNEIDYSEAVKEVAEYIDGGVVTPVSYTPPPPKPKVPEKVQLAKLLKVWSGGQLIDRRAVPAMRYLESRGLSGIAKIPSALRYHPSLEYWTEDDDGNPVFVDTFPAIIGMATDVINKTVTVHRTYLTPDGNKVDLGDDRDAKKWMSPIFEGATRELGASIKLGYPRQVQGVCEGIENGLTILLVYGITIWPCMSSGIIPHVKLPRCVKHVFNFVDNDLSKAGEKAAAEFEEKHADDELLITNIMPAYNPEDGKGTDWNDILLREGRDGFPPLESPFFKKPIYPR